jgi:hypothetical protein
MDRKFALNCNILHNAARSISRKGFCFYEVVYSYRDNPFPLLYVIPVSFRTGDFAVQLKYLCLIKTRDLASVAFHYR